MKPDDTDIESALVDALEVELEDYQCASESWTAVRMAIDGLRRRDARIEQLEKALGEACTIAIHWVEGRSPVSERRIRELIAIRELAGEDLDKALEAALAKYKAQPSGN